MGLARYAWLILLCGLPPTMTPAHAATVLTTTVTHESGRYHVKFEVRLQAAADKVRALITDYTREIKLSDTIVERRLLGTNEDGSLRVRVVLRACVLFFCQSMNKVTDVQTLPNGDVFVLTDPKESDFHFGREHWHFIDEGEHSRLQYEADLTPVFYVPPLIGPWLVKGRIADELETTAERLEKLANELPSPPARPPVAPPPWRGPGP
jgi:hypothetical protein